MPSIDPGDPRFTSELPLADGRTIRLRPLVPEDDPAYRPVGAVAVSQMLRAAPSTPLAQIMEPVTEITVDQDQEEVAYIFNKYHLISAPVVEAGGRLVGQITVDDVVHIIQEEAGEDVLLLAGVGDEGDINEPVPLTGLMTAP